ncbi:hypothetical protein NDN08_004329 [Rhodosorus marinus]|uniref:BTB domain-containing protein n=1 Tax=Rhodosorus marinus TaxID=101924 RepID=A0AAV8UMG0_9RHOD|nr:hypothetical protein NDN08_004329 [Rhodosorus marinus]
MGALGMEVLRSTVSDTVLLTEWSGERKTLRLGRGDWGKSEAFSRPRDEVRVLSSKRALLKRVHELYLLGIDTDLSISVTHGEEQVEIQTHKVLIAARCTGLRKQIDLDAKQGNRGQLKWAWTDVCPTIASAVVEFFYTGKIRVSDKRVFSLWDFAVRLGADSLAEICRKHVTTQLSERNCIFFLDQAHQNPRLGLMRVITDCFRTNSHKVVGTKQFSRLRPEVLEFLLQLEDLSCTEEQLWHAVIRWGMANSFIPQQSLREVQERDRERILQSVARFVRPGLLRIYDIDPCLFAREVEPSGLLTTGEIIERYRYDSVLGFAGLKALYSKKAEVAKRTRRRVAMIESDHPHPTGVLASLSKRVVEFPAWCREITVTFDTQTSLGKYSDLCFFLDEHEQRKVFSLHLEKRQQRSQRIEETPALQVVIPQRRFWYTFYSPANFGPDWGYLFKCVISKSDFDEEETAIDRLARQNLFGDSPVE